MKVLIHKKTGEFAHYMGRGEFATCSLPQIFPDTMNREFFKKYVLEQEGCELMIDDYEIKNIEIITK